MQCYELVPVASHLGIKADHYKASKNGMIWSETNNKFLAYKPRRDGYIVGGFMTVEGFPKSKLFHVVIYETFHGPTPQGMVIDHINRNRADNRISNLRFVTVAENNTNRSAPTKPNGGLRPIAQYTLSGELVCEWESAGAIENALGISANWIARCIGKLQPACGFQWRYNEPDLQGEIWKEYLGIKVSNMGRVRFRSGRVTFGYDSRGYRKIKYKRFSYFVHRLVCEVFNEPQPSLEMVVNHINEITHDNRPENLKWTTPADNARHSNNQAVKQLRLDGTLVAVYPSFTVASQVTGFEKSTISIASRGGISEYKGFHWSLVDPSRANASRGRVLIQKLIYPALTSSISKWRKTSTISPSKRA